MCDRASSRPRRSAWTAARRSSRSIFQVPWPTTGTSRTRPNGRLRMAARVARRMPRVTVLSRTALAIRARVFADLAPRIEAHARAGGDLVALHIGDTHRMPPPEARFASVEGAAADPARYRYGAIAGVAALKAAFVRTPARTGRGPRDADAARHVLVGAGATHAIYCGLRAVLDPGDEVLVAAPYWPLSVGV